MVGSTQWTTNLSSLSFLEDYAEDETMQKRWQEAHRKCKRRLAEFIERTQGITIPEHFLFDVMVKRIHEYKRQLLDILYVIYRYQWIKGLSESERKMVVPRVVFFGGKVNFFERFFPSRGRNLTLLPAPGYNGTNASQIKESD